jgi:diguanylate cyclase
MGNSAEHSDESVNRAKELSRQVRAFLDENNHSDEAYESLAEGMEILRTVDHLTGLMTEAKIREDVSNLMSLVDRQGGSLSVVYLDVDRFKRYNDTYGHDVGDQVLIYVANCLKKVVRPYDPIARIGDEFIIALRCPPDHSFDMESLRMRIDKAISDGSGNKPELKDLTLSIGFSTYRPGDRVNPDNLFQRADAAMYESKRFPGTTITSWDRSLAKSPPLRGMTQM